MAQKDQIDQDALAAEWGVALEAEQSAAADAPPAGRGGRGKTAPGSHGRALGGHGR